VNTCSVYSLEALQADFEDPFLGPPTGCAAMAFQEVKWHDPFSGNGDKTGMSGSTTLGH
jgi:hypothetical protein